VSAASGDPSTRRVRRIWTRRTLPAVLAAGALLGVPGGARAAWTAVREEPLVGGRPVVVTGAAGQATVVVSTDAGAEARVHEPGATGWSPGASVATGDLGQVLGPGGAVATSRLDGASQVVEVRRFGPDGTLADLGSFSTGVDALVDAVAVAPDGSAVVAVDTVDGQLEAWYRSAAGTWSTTTPAGAALVDSADVAVGPSGLLTVAWAETDEEFSLAVGAATYGPAGTVGAPAWVDDLRGAARTVDDVVAVPSRGGEQAAAWIDADEEGADARVRGGTPGAVRTLASGAQSEEASDLVVADVAGRTVATWTAGADAPTSWFADLAGTCVAASELTTATVADRAGQPVAVGLRGGRIVVAPIGAACDATVDAEGPDAAEASSFAAAADGEGTLVAAAAGAPGPIAADDRTPPRIDRIDLPASATVGTPFTASAVAVDAWGIGTVRWTIDGKARTGATVSGTLSRAGDRAVELRVRDAAGNDRTTSRTVRGVAATGGSSAAPPSSSTPAAPSVSVDLPGPGSTGGMRARPTVQVLRARRRGSTWFGELRIRNADGLRLELYRERYQKPSAMRRPPTCPARRRPVRRPPTGKRGVLVVRAGAGRIRVRLPWAMQKALRKRGRYTLRAVARGNGGIRVDKLRFTVCAER